MYGVDMYGCGIGPVSPVEVACGRCGASCCTRPHGHKGLCLGECDVHWKIAESNHLPFDLLCRNVRSNDAAVFSGWKDSPRFVVTWYYLKYVECDLMRLLWECINKLESNCRVRAVLRMLRFVCKLQGPTMASRLSTSLHLWGLSKSLPDPEVGSQFKATQIPVLWDCFMNLS